MSKFKNREVVYKDKDGNIYTTYFRGTDFFSILEYFEKFKDSMVEIIQINNPDYWGYGNDDRREFNREQD